MFSGLFKIVSLPLSKARYTLIYVRLFESKDLQVIVHFFSVSLDLLTASPVVSDTDRTEGGRLIFAKFGQCGQHTSQRSPITSKAIFVTRFGHQEALQFFTI